MLRSLITRRNISFFSKPVITQQTKPTCHCESYCKYEKNKIIATKYENLSMYTDVGIIGLCGITGFISGTTFVIPVGCGLIIAHRFGFAIPLQEEFKRKLDKYQPLCKNLNK